MSDESTAVEIGGDEAMPVVDTAGAPQGVAGTEAGARPSDAWPQLAAWQKIITILIAESQ